MNKELETHIMVALFKATIEQSYFLNNQFKQKSKQVFNNWQKSGNTLLTELEKKDEINHEFIEVIADAIHNLINEARKENERIDREELH